MIDDEPVVHPTRRQMASSCLNLIVSGIENNKIVMLEAGAQDVQLQTFMRAVKVGMKEVTRIVLALRPFAEKYGKPKRAVKKENLPSEEMLAAAERETLEKITDVMLDWSHDKVSRDNALAAVMEEALQKLVLEFSEAQSDLLKGAINRSVKTAFRRLVLEKGERMDGRKFSDVRPIFCDVDLLQPLHGSALFQRGQTQVMCTVSFDSPDSAVRMKDPVSQILDSYKEQNFMLHYEFPAYATNEISRSSRVGRREFGHGNLAERALAPLVPSDFPFAIRLTCEVLESNGSSSMASVCGGTLALLDAGVKLSAPAAGVAMGLVSVPHPENPKELADYKILTDILGIEDYLGEMDFKIAGSAKGITALQADMKVPGLPLKVIMETIMQGFSAKAHILKIMSNTISTAREVRKDNWPVTEKLEVPAHKRSHFLGLGCRNLKRITAETGVTFIPLDDNTFDVFAPNQVSHPSVLNLEKGQEIQVKYYGRDPVSGQMRLSRKVLQAPPSSIMKNLLQKR
ncbi:polyribonucleotide nucleotidyltransferase 1 [Tropilaelaps mercedesae]|uniref:Polyribonucleotide nucleotidyltransferase 1 n=1 Tax=Tropilaelaps mercedesae TaxID=418985 RepID=A0A1V9X2A0_9ACAR|nr:polyribonucleotide nucleotidyltransferase 1 [Tropilaelaps mercedesae]